MSMQCRAVRGDLGKHSKNLDKPIKDHQQQEKVSGGGALPVGHALQYTQIVVVPLYDKHVGAQCAMRKEFKKTQYKLSVLMLDEDGFMPVPGYSFPKDDEEEEEEEEEQDE